MDFRKRIGHWIQTGLLAAFGAGGLLVTFLDVFSELPLWIKGIPEIILAIVSAIAVHLAVEHWQTVSRIDKLEAAGLDARFTGLSHAARNRLLPALNHYVELYHLRKQQKRSRRVFPDLVDEYMTEHFRALQRISAGVLSVPHWQTSYAQHLLCRHYHERFDAVSERDLDFWLSSESVEYMRAGPRGAHRPRTIANRVFIFSIHELASRQDDIVKILRRQSHVGIGWGVAIWEELDPDVTGAGLDLDFALFDRGVVATYFRRREGRRFEAVFLTPANQERLAGQRLQFEKLVGECWLADPRFNAEFPGSLSSDGRRRFVEKAQRSNAEARELIGVEAADPRGFLLLASRVDQVDQQIVELTSIVQRLHAIRGERH